MNMVPVVIDVTADDIANGARGNNSFCAVACGVRRAVKNIARVNVHGPTVEMWSVLGAYQHVTLPGAVRNFVADFDSRKPVEPMTFTVHVQEYFVLDYDATGKPKGHS